MLHSGYWEEEGGLLAGAEGVLEFATRLSEWLWLELADVAALVLLDAAAVVVVVVVAAVLPAVLVCLIEVYIQRD